MSAPAPAPSDAESISSDDEDIDGLIAAVLQDIEIQDVIKEGHRESESDHDGKTGDTQTNHIHANNHDDKSISSVSEQGDKNNKNHHEVAPTKEAAAKPLMAQSQATNKSAHVNSIVDKESKRMIGTKIALTKITTILREVDEDNDGEIDYEEFCEALRLIDSNLNHIEIDQIYQHFIYKEDDELSIKLFIDLLEERCKTIASLNIDKITPKMILQHSFKFIQSSALNKIYDILREKDEDDNLCIDWGEFEEAMLDLEVNLGQTYLQSVYKLICNKQNHKELNIKLFIKELAELRGGDENNLNYNDILTKYFNALLPPHIHRQQKEKRKKRVRTMNDVHRYCGAALHKNRKHLKKHKKKPKLARFNSTSLLQTCSILQKANCSVIVTSALCRELNEVDDNHDGRVDCVEFVEALATLKSSISGIRATKLFYNLIDDKVSPRNILSSSPQEAELSINNLIADIQKMYLKYPTLTGDQCLEKVGALCSRSAHHQRSTTMNSVSSTYSVRSVASMFSFQSMDEKEEFNDTVKEIQSIVASRADGNDTVDKEEFIDILSEWGIDEKFNQTELLFIFNQLIDGDENEASCHLFIRRVQEVLFDHPNYSPRRAVYRVCRRLLKQRR